MNFPAIFEAIGHGYAVAVWWVNQFVNPTLWVLAQILLLTVTLAVVFYAVFNRVWFPINETKAGRRVYDVIFSLLLIVVLVDIGNFVNPRANPWVYTTDIFWWRPLLRVAFFGFVTVAFVRLDYLLFDRWKNGSPFTVVASPRKHRPKL